MGSSQRQRLGAFSLIELVIVIVIIGIIAAIAIPRMSQGAAGASDTAQKADLTILQNALDLYAAEHNGIYPDETNVAQQLTEYSSADGTVSATHSASAIYGPYLRDVPGLPSGTNKGSTAIASADGSTVGWVYTRSTDGKSYTLAASTYSGT